MCVASHIALFGDIYTISKTNTRQIKDMNYFKIFTQNINSSLLFLRKQGEGEFLAVPP